MYTGASFQPPNIPTVLSFSERVTSNAGRQICRF
jgi:hypothetical protein